jgi:uncharacterized membrane protein YfcA
MTLWFAALAAFVSIIAGATASVVGFGIGSLLTPLIAWHFGTETAVAAIALPHFAGGMLRGWRLRSEVDRAVLVRFGILSAVGGLIGAMAFANLAPRALGFILGMLLVLTATAGLTEWSKRWKPRGAVVWALGALSGFFGGVVGNQGGLRAAALSRFGLKPTAFVATSTVIGVMIDVVRSPIYLFRVGERLADLWILIVVMIFGVLAGTIAGERLLLGMSRSRFQMVVSVAIGALGIWFVARTLKGG